MRVLLSFMVLLLLISSDLAASTLKKQKSQSTHPLANQEKLAARDEFNRSKKHCPKSDIQFIKCESDGDFLPLKHPADGDGPWWQGAYSADE